MIDIKNKRIKKLTREIINKLSWLNLKSKEQSAYYTLISECIDIIILRKINPYKKELEEDIKNYTLQIKRLNVSKGISKSWIEEVKEKRRLLKEELMNLNTDKDIENTYGYCKQIYFPKKKSGLHPQFKIVLLEDNIKSLSDKKIKLLVGHEIAHAYIKLVANYGNINHYEIDDRLLCDFIAKKLFKVI